MFSDEELQIIFSVFESLNTEVENELKLKKKMSLLCEELSISREANEKIRKIDNEIRSLYEEAKNEVQVQE